MSPRMKAGVPVTQFTDAQGRYSAVTSHPCCVLPDSHTPTLLLRLSRNGKSHNDNLFAQPGFMPFGDRSVLGGLLQPRPKAIGQGSNDASVRDLAWAALVFVSRACSVP